MSKELVLGIDFGIDNSICSLYRNGNPEIIPKIYGLFYTFSLVIFVDENSCIAIRKAWGYSIRYRDSVVSDMKRVIGLKYDEVSEAIKIFSFGFGKKWKWKSKNFN